MNNEQVLEILEHNWTKLVNPDYTDKELGQALDLVIKALNNPTGDAISRSALKEDFKSRLADCDEWIEKAKDKETKIRASAVKAFIWEVIMTINNAQAVEPRIEYGTDGQPYKMSMTNGKEYERPQGDCISRSALKKAMWSLVINENDDIPILNVIETIDNAQIVFDCGGCKNNGRNKP